MWKLLFVSVVVAVVTSAVAQIGSSFSLFGTGPPTDPGTLGTFGGASPTSGTGSSGGPGMSFLPFLLTRGMGEIPFPMMMMAMKNPQMMPFFLMNSGGDIPFSTLLMMSMMSNGGLMG